MALVLRDGLALLALVALFVVLVNQSERTAPRWLRRRDNCIVDAILDMPWP